MRHGEARRRLGEVLVTVLDEVKAPRSARSVVSSEVGPAGSVPHGAASEVFLFPTAWFAGCSFASSCWNTMVLTKKGGQGANSAESALHLVGTEWRQGRLQVWEVLALVRLGKMEDFLMELTWLTFGDECTFFLKKNLPLPPPPRN